MFIQVDRDDRTLVTVGGFEKGNPGAQRWFRLPWGKRTSILLQGLTEALEKEPSNPLLGLTVNILVEAGAYFSGVGCPPLVAIRHISAGLQKKLPYLGGEAEWEYPSDQGTLGSLRMGTHVLGQGWRV